MVVKVSPSITLQLEKSGQKITLDFDEAKEIIKSLSQLANQMRSNVATTNAIEGNGKQNGTTTKKRKVKAAYKNEKKTGKRRKRIGRKSSKMDKSSPQKGRKTKVPYMSENKRQEIIKHITRQLSAKPKTLSALLEGVSYVPNYLPTIRQMVESRGKNIHREKIGKRIYYSKKGASTKLKNRKKD
jgi:hypothetical protein